MPSSEKGFSCFQEIGFRELGCIGGVGVVAGGVKRLEVWDAKVLVMRLEGYTHQQISDYLGV